MKASARALSWVLLTLLALTSALLCIAPPSLGSWFGVLYVGTVYGVLLTVYFITCCGIRSAPRLISLVVASSLAWPIAYFGSFAAMGFIPGGTVHHGDSVEPAFPLIALGGVLGGAALLIPALLLFKPSSVSRGAALRKAFWGILLSGIVGGIAWELGPILGSAIWHLLPTAPLPPSDSYGMAALFFVWQPVIALFIGWATSENQEPIPIQASQAKSEQGAQGPQISGGFHRRTFAVIVASLAVLSLTRIIPLRLRLAHRERAVAKMRGSRPSGVDLPIAQPMTEKDALILKPIGTYQPSHVMKTWQMVSHGKGFESPGARYFSAFYTKNRPAGSPAADPRSRL